MSASGENVVSEGPLGLISRDIGDLVLMLEAFSEIMDSRTLSEFAEDVQALPPEQRFKESFRVYEGIFDVDDITEADLEDLPNPISEWLSGLEEEEKQEKIAELFRILIKRFRELRSESIDRVLQDRQNSQDYVVFIVYLSYILQNFREIEYRLSVGTDFDDNKEIASELVALLSHLILIGLGEKEEIDENLIRDIAWYAYFHAQRQGEETDLEPDHEDVRNILAGISRRGSLDLYNEAHISISRGAELANISRKEFQNALLDRGIDPRLGPRTPEELHRDKKLTKSD